MRWAGSARPVDRALAGETLVAHALVHEVPPIALRESVEVLSTDLQLEPLAGRHLEGDEVGRAVHARPVSSPTGAMVDHHRVDTEQRLRLGGARLQADLDHDD